VAAVPLRRLLRRLTCGLRPQRVPFVYSGRYVMEVGGIPHDPRRGENVLTFLAMEGLLRRGGLRWPREASIEALARIHTGDYLDSLLAPGGLLRIVGLRLSEADGDRLLGVQRAMVGGTLLATRLALASRRPAVNLGGGLHHAHADHGNGFCIFNDVAVAIADSRQRGFGAPVLVVDLDLHDGDGTRALFARDPSVYTYSVHNQDWDDAPAVASTAIPLGGEVGDEAYLATVRETLPEVISSFRPGLVYYLAGCDPAADDALGNWRITPAGMLARDRFVLSRLHRLAGGVPLVIVLAGGYGSEAWRYSARAFAWLLSGGQTIEPPSSVEITLRRYRHLASLLGPADLTREGDDGDFQLSAEDLLPRAAAAAPPNRFLGYYSTHGIELALERYGYLARLRTLGFHPNLVFQLDHPAGQTLRIFGDDEQRELLVELRLRVDHRTVPGLALLFVEWLLLQNPRAAFEADHPPLPGQQHPGLGLLQETTALLVLVCDRLGLDGVAFVPSHYHLAHQSERYLRFLEPADEGRFRALCGALRGLPLAAASRAVAEGRVVDADSGRPVEWQPTPMVLPVGERLKERVEGEDYERQAAAAAARHRFRLVP
jgi:acetoin utilization deacetylase AcuC-like enzyme